VSLLLITYDLHTQGHDYEPFKKAIMAYSTEWWHFLQNTWLIQSNHSADTVGNGLLQYITTNDRLLVIDVRGNGQGWLPKEAWDWIRARSQ